MLFWRHFVVLVLRFTFQSLSRRLRKMTQNEYNNKVAEAALALIHHLITYNEWEQWMKKLIKEKEQ